MLSLYNFSCFDKQFFEALLTMYLSIRFQACSGESLKFLMTFPHLSVQFDCPFSILFNVELHKDTLSD